MTRLDLIGGRYLLYLQRQEKPKNFYEKILDQIEGVPKRHLDGWGRICERKRRLGHWNILVTFNFMTESIGLDLDTFFVAKPFETLCDGTPRDEVTRWLEKPTTFLVDALCAAKLDEIALWEAAKLAECGGERYRLPLPLLTFGPIDQRTIEIGYGRRMAENKLVFED